MTTTHITIDWNNEQLTASIDYPIDFHTLNATYPLIIICHGFTGSRVGVDRLFVKSARDFNKDGYIVVRFDYAGCGESTGEYGNTGLSDLIEQTKAVINFAWNLEGVDKENIFLLGHSLGGATALLTAVRDSRIRKLILWSAVGNPYNDIEQIVSTEKVYRLQSETYFEYLGYAFTNKFFQSLKRYEPFKELNAFNGDVLITHGTLDEEIPVIYSYEYEKEFTLRPYGMVERYEIQGANHTYSCLYHYNQLIECTRKWIQKKLQESKLVLSKN